MPPMPPQRVLVGAPMWAENPLVSVHQSRPGLHYESPFQKVDFRPGAWLSAWRSVLVYLSRLGVLVDDFFSRHPSLLVAIRAVCLLSFIFLLLLSLDDAYAWFRYWRHRKTGSCRAGGGEEGDAADEKGRLRRHFAGSNGFVTDEAPEDRGPGLIRLGSDLMTRELAPGSRLHGPGESLSEDGGPDSPVSHTNGLHVPVKG